MRLRTPAAVISLCDDLKIGKIALQFAAGVVGAARFGCRRKSSSPTGQSGSRSYLVRHRRCRPARHKTVGDRCPGESRDPSNRARAVETWTPAYRRGSAHYCLSSQTALFLSRNRPDLDLDSPLGAPLRRPPSLSIGMSLTHSDHQSL